MQLGKFIALGILGLSLSFSLSSSVFADGGITTLIHGCVAKDGTTRIVSPTTACKNTETARHWPTDARIVADEARITATETQNATQQAAITTLQGQVGGGSGGLVVKDSLGQMVGKAIDSSNGQIFTVFRQIGNTPLFFQVIPTQINNSNPTVFFVYTSNNCTGTRYITSDAAAGFVFADIPRSSDGQTFYFPTFPTQSLTIQSSEIFQAGENPSGVGACDNSFGSFEYPGGTVSTVSIATLGAPPFHLE